MFHVYIYLFTSAPISGRRRCCCCCSCVHAVDACTFSIWYLVFDTIGWHYCRFWRTNTMHARSFWAIQHEKCASLISCRFDTIVCFVRVFVPFRGLLLRAFALCIRMGCTWRPPSKRHSNWTSRKTTISFHYSMCAHTRAPEKWNDPLSCCRKMLKNQFDETFPLNCYKCWKHPQITSTYRTFAKKIRQPFQMNANARNKNV